MKHRGIIAAALAVLMIFTLAACGSKTKSEVRIGVLKGPTGIGSAYLMSQNEKGESLNKYSFSSAAAPTDLTSRLISGELDMAALPTNVAAALYAKTNGNVQIIALNTLGVLYILENGSSVKSISDLRGKTVYATGQGSNPEYVLNFILRQNGLEPKEDVNIVYMDASELTTRMAAGIIDLCMLPVPNVTTALMKNKNVKIALDLTDEWNKISGGSELTMGCIVIRKNANLKADTISDFLKEYKNSIDYVNKNIKEASQLVAKYEITGSAEIAAAAIPDCNLTCITGADSIKTAIEGYYKVLFDADPTSIGGSVPNAEFYYKK